jgi:predicted Zn-dependent peptidase
VAESTGNKPFTAAELADAQSSQLGTWPLNFESTGYLLGATLGVRRYGLPTDWIQSMPSRVRAVDVGAANAAWSRHMSQGRLMVVVVGDEAVVRPELEKLGRPIVKLDPDGKVVK